MVRVLCLLIALSSCFPNDWRKQDQALESASLVFLGLDWRQTTVITSNCSEANPIIGECGERVSPNIYFPIVMVMTMAIARWLPPNLRSTFQGAILGAEVATTWDNWRSE